MLDSRTTARQYPQTQPAAPAPVQHTSRTWRDNAAEWVALGKQGKDVRLALLIACSVRRPAQSPDQAPGKTTAQEFADATGTTAQRVLRHLDAWDAAARKRLCPPSGGLSPVDAVRANVQVPTDAEFSAVYDASRSGGRPRASVDEISNRIERDPAYAQRLLDSIASSYPGMVAPADRTGTDSPSGGTSRSGHHRSDSQGSGGNTAEDRVERLPGRIASLDGMLGGLVKEIRVLSTGSTAYQAGISRRELSHMLSKHLDTLDSMAV